MANENQQIHLINTDKIFLNNRNDKKTDHIVFETNGVLGENNVEFSNCNVDVKTGFLKAPEIRCNGLKDADGRDTITLSSSAINFHSKTINNFSFSSGSISASSVSSANGFASLDAELDALTTNKLSITGHTASKLFVSSSGGGITTSSTSTSQLATAISNANSALQNFNDTNETNIIVGGGVGSNFSTFKFKGNGLVGGVTIYYALMKLPNVLTGDITLTLPGATGTLQLQPTEGAFANGDKTKLDAIEASATADQTASEIRALVESATDSNVFTDADHTKLNGIEASATADQTASEIRALVESASDSNVFTNDDHTKLGGIEVGADITNESRVRSVGALMDDEMTNLSALKAMDVSTLQVKPSEGSFSNGDKTALDASVAKLTGITFGNSSPHTNATRIGQGNNQLFINNDNAVNSNSPGDGGFMEYNSIDFLLLRKPSTSSHWNLIFDRGDRYWSGFRSTHHWDTYDGTGVSGFGKWIKETNGEVMYLNHYSDGDVNVCGGGGSFVNASDNRLKHNEKKINNACEILNKLEVLKYFKTSKLYDENHHFQLDGSGNPITDEKYKIETGFIAQEVEKIPELKHLVRKGETREDGEEYSYSLNYQDIFSYNVKATQELDERVKILEAEITNIKAELQKEKNKTIYFEDKLRDIEKRLSNASL